MRVLSFILSSIFHPIFVPLLGFLLLYSFSGYTLYLPEDVFWFSVLVIVQFTILIPIGVIYFLYWRKKISSIQLSVREERPLPLVINLMSYAVSFVIFRYLNFPHIIVSFFGAIVVSATLAMLMSLTYKISLHMIAWGTLLGVVLAFALGIGKDLHFLVSLIILVTGFVATARLWLNEHDLKQIGYAWLSSSVVSFLIMIYI